MGPGNYAGSSGCRTATPGGIRSALRLPAVAFKTRRLARQVAREAVGRVACHEARRERCLGAAGQVRRLDA